MKIRVPFVAIVAIVAGLMGFKTIGNYYNEAVGSMTAMEYVAQVAEEKPMELIVEGNRDDKEEEDIVVKQTFSTYSSPINFSELRNINEDVEAYIKIGDKISYPVLFDESDKYLTQDIYGNHSKAGSIFFDQYLDPAGALRVVYGHHMNDSWATKKEGSMFAIIDDYNKKSQFESGDAITMYYPDHEETLTPMVCVRGISDGALRDIHTAHDLRAFANDKEITQGSIADFTGNLYVFVTCNYAGDDFRTYLFCTAE